MSEEGNVIVIGIDPGPEMSAYVRWDGTRVLGHGIERNANAALLRRDAADIHSAGHEVTVFELVESYGMAVGARYFQDRPRDWPAL